LRKTYAHIREGVCVCESVVIR